MLEGVFELAESVARPTYEDDFYAHLSGLAALEFTRLNGSNRRNFRYDMSKYLSLGQAAFEEGPRFEHAVPSEVDWDKIDDQVSGFTEYISHSLGKENDSQESFVLFSAKCFENWVTYRTMYPDSSSNPWSRTVSMMRRGRLLFVSDQLEELQTVAKSRVSFDDQTKGNIGVVIKGKPPQTSGFVIDNRFDVQKKVLSFLRHSAPNRHSPVSLRRIKEHLADMNIDWPIDAIQIKITTPLKKAGVVGSTGKGFFVIESLDDLIASYCFHLPKSISINAILKQYEARAREFGEGIDLEGKCKERSLNEIS